MRVLRQSVLLLAALAVFALVLQPVAALLSFLLAFACVAIPQQIAFFAFRRQTGAMRFGSLFGIWGLKFSLTLLFLVVGLKLAMFGGILSVPLFVAGAVVGVATNVYIMMRQTPARVAG